MSTCTLYSGRPLRMRFSRKLLEQELAKHIDDGLPEIESRGIELRVSRIDLSIHGDEGTLVLTCEEAPNG